MRPSLPATDELRAAVTAWGAGPDTSEGAVFKALADMVDEVKQTAADMKGLDLAKIEAMHIKAAKAGLQGAAKSMTRSLDRKGLAWLVGALTLALLAGGGGGYLVRQPPAPMTATWQQASAGECRIELRTVP